MLDFTHIPARLSFLAINLQADTKSDAMKTKFTTEELIEKMLASTGENPNNPREQYLLRETLYSLTRLVRSEQLIEIRQSVTRLIPATLRPIHIRRGKGRRNGPSPAPGQINLAFGRQE